MNDVEGKACDYLKKERPILAGQGSSVFELQPMTQPEFMVWLPVRVLG